MEGAVFVFAFLLSDLQILSFYSSISVSLVSQAAAPIIGVLSRKTQRSLPKSPKSGVNKTVRTIFWPWLEPFSTRQPLKTCKLYQFQKWVVKCHKCHIQRSRPK